MWPTQRHLHNYILTRMRDEGASIEAVLKDAQALGYAEADPSLDVDGHDAAQKLTVLYDIGVWRRGADRIRRRHPRDRPTGFQVCRAFWFRNQTRGEWARPWCALGVARASDAASAEQPTFRRPWRLEPRVHSRWALGPCLLVGRGAGEMPTAVGVVADIVDVARARVEGASGLAPARSNRSSVSWCQWMKSKPDITCGLR